MKTIIIALAVFWGIIACTVIIGSNTTHIDRKSGIILETQNEEQNTDEKEAEKAHEGIEKDN